MTAHLTVESRSDVVLRLMADAARSLGCQTDDSEITSGRFVRIQVPAGGSDVFELLSQLALSTRRAGVHVDEPLFRATLQHDGADSVATLSLRLMQFDVKAAPGAAGA